MTIETAASKMSVANISGAKETLLGAFLLAWAAICGIYGAVPLASFCLVCGTVLFCAGFVLMIARPVRVAAWLRKYF